MIDLKPYADYYVQHPSKYALIHRTNGRIIPITIKDYDNYRWNDFPEDMQNEYGSFNDYYMYFPPKEEAIRIAFAREKGNKELTEGSQTAKAFKPLLRKNGMEKAYADFRENVVRSLIGCSAYLDDVLEKEASPAQYKRIRALLEKIDDGCFEERFSDSNLFKLNIAPNAYASFVVMGNNKTTYGITFYLDLLNQSYQALVENDKESVSPLIGLLSNTVTFYFEKKNGENGFLGEKTTIYGEDGRFSSVAMQEGTMRTNWLGEHLAMYMETLLKYAYKALCKANKEPMIITDFATDVEVFAKGSGVRISYHRQTFKCDSFFPYTLPCRIHLAHPNFNNYVKGAMDFSVQVVTVMPEEDDGDPRFSQAVLVAVLADSNKGLVVASLLISKREGLNLFDSMLASAQENLEGFALAKTIYVNSLVEENIAKFLFDNALRQKKVKIVLTDEVLVSDEAIDMVIEMFEKGEGINEA